MLMIKQRTTTNLCSKFTYILKKKPKLVITPYINTHTSRRFCYSMKELITRLDNNFHVKLATS